MPESTPEFTTSGSWRRLISEYPQLASSQLMEALQQYLPQLSELSNTLSRSSALSELDTQRAVSPGQNQLALDLYSEFAPQFAEAGQEVNRSNALAQADLQNEVLSGAGGDYLTQLDSLVRRLNPEFYSAISTTGNRINDLLGSVDLSGNLSNTELDSIAKGLAREGIQRGDYNAPSATSTVSNAMRYGEKGRERVTQNQSILSDAISKATQFVSSTNPNTTGAVNAGTAASLGSGINQTSNQGSNQFQGVSNPTAGSSTTNQAMNALTGNVGAAQNNAVSGFTAGSQATMANQKDWLDKFQQFTGGLGNLGNE